MLLRGMPPGASVLHNKNRYLVCLFQPALKLDLVLNSPEVVDDK
jgi:hypothetical protein